MNLLLESKGTFDDVGKGHLQDRTKLVTTLKKSQGRHPVAHTPPAEGRTLATVSHLPPNAAGSFADPVRWLSV